MITQVLFHHELDGRGYLNEEGSASRNGKLNFNRVVTDNPRTRTRTRLGLHGIVRAMPYDTTLTDLDAEGLPRARIFAAPLDLFFLRVDLLHHVLEGFKDRTDLFAGSNRTEKYGAGWGGVGWGVPLYCLLLRHGPVGHATGRPLFFFETKLRLLLPIQTESGHHQHLHVGVLHVFCGTHMSISCIPGTV